MVASESVVSEIDSPVSSTFNFNIIKNLREHIMAVSRVSEVQCVSQRQYDWISAVYMCGNVPGDGVEKFGHVLNASSGACACPNLPRPLGIGTCDA